MEGIVLYSLSYKEQSKLVYLYTSLGIQSVLVRKLKENGSFITTFNIVSYEVSKGKLPTLISFEVVKNYFDFSNQLDKVSSLMVLIQVIRSIGSDAPHGRIYPFFKKCLEVLYEANDVRFILAIFLTKMLAVLGIRPVLNRCVRCNRTDLVGFSVIEGGALCTSCCTNSNRSLLDGLTQLYYDQSYDEKRYSIPYDEVLKALKEYYLNHAHLNLKMLDKTS